VDDARFFNHADVPNIHDQDLTSIAARDIVCGEELTCKYSKWALKHLLGQTNSGQADSTNTELYEARIMSAFEGLI
jgi:hypothetical protein